MPEHNEEIGERQAKELGMPRGKYVYKLCTNRCGVGRYVKKRKYTSSGPCKSCTQREFHKGKV